MVGRTRELLSRVTNQGSAQGEAQSVSIVPDGTPFSTTTTVLQIPADGMAAVVVRCSPGRFCSQRLQLI